jgi:hypothetical protein
MADDEEIAVTIEQETPEAGAVTVEKTDDKQVAVDPVADLKGQFETLQTQTANERQRREAAERARAFAEERATQAERQASQALGRAAESQYDTVLSGLEAAKAESESAEREYQAAYDAGDGKAMAAAQRKMARAEARAVEYEGAKNSIEARARRSDQEQTVERRTEPTEASQVQQPSDPVEAYISQRTEPTQKWLREHKEWISDPSKNAKLTAAHWNAVGDGLAPDTPQYFEHVEKFIGLRQASKSGNGAARKSGGPPVAPVGSPSGGGANGGSNTVTLTAGEARAATDGTLTWNYPDPTGKNRWKKGDAIGVQEFARRKQEMKKQGLYDKSLTEG